LFDAYGYFDDAGSDDEDVGRGYGDGVDRGPIDGGNDDSHDAEFDDGDLLVSHQSKGCPK
jgi:hypothetical protein